MLVARPQHALAEQGGPPAHACAFADRCPDVMPRCREARPALAAVAPGQQAACFLHHDVIAR